MPKSSDGRAPSLKPRWATGEVTLGAWCMMPGALGVETVAGLGFDWVLVDMQHGCMGYEGALEMIRAADIAGVCPIVRVPWNEPGIIGRVLDAGAMGVLIPMIESVDDARRAIDAALYPPAGRRSFGPVRVGMRDGMTYAMDANERIAVILMIETAAALAAAEEIAALPGADALFVGPFDLSVALGLPPGDNDGKPAFDEAISRVIAACKRNGKAAAVLSNASVAPLRVEQGFQMISVTTDTAALASASAASLAAVKKKMGDGNA